ncbi:MAG: hypothetical protein HPY57_13030 [Ignavibacteria bacterium]|nr:hypothetical protein [Ignavibacteria bacterium]
MRYFRIPTGQYEGEYIIYDNIEEFKKHNPNKEYFRWGEFSPSQVQVGDYIEAYDGYLLPLLNISKLKDNYLFRFPNGTFALYKTKKGYKFNKFYGMTTNIDQFSLSGKSKLTRNLESDAFKEQFALLVASGIDPVRALKMVLAPKLKMTVSKRKFLSILIKLLNDEGVMEQIRDIYNSEFLKKIQEDPDFSDENLLDYVKSFMKNVRKGSQTHLNSILPLLKLTGKLPEDFTLTPKKEKNNVKDIDYTEIPPEQLPPTTENSQF